MVKPSKADLEKAQDLVSDITIHKVEEKTTYFQFIDILAEALAEARTEKQVNQVKPKNTFTRYITLGVATFIMSLLVYGTFVDMLGFPAVLVTLVWVPSGVMFRYYVNKRYIWN